MVQLLGKHAVLIVAVLAWKCQVGLGSLIISKYRQDPQGDRYVEIRNAGAEAVDLHAWRIKGLEFQSTVKADNVHDLLQTFHSFKPGGRQLAPGATYIIADPESGEAIIRGADMLRKMAFDSYAIAKMPDEHTFEIIDSVGHPYRPDWDKGWEACGVQSATMQFTMIRKSFVTTGNHGKWSVSAGTDTRDCQWELLPFGEGDQGSAIDESPPPNPPGAAVNTTSLGGRLNVDFKPASQDREHHLLIEREDLRHDERLRGLQDQLESLTVALILCAVLCALLTSILVRQCVWGRSGCLSKDRPLTSLESISGNAAAASGPVTGSVLNLESHATSDSVADGAIVIGSPVSPPSTDPMKESPEAINV